MKVQNFTTFKLGVAWVSIILLMFLLDLVIGVNGSGGATGSGNAFVNMSFIDLILLNFPGVLLLFNGIKPESLLGLLGDYLYRTGKPVFDKIESFINKISFSEENKRK